MIQKLIAFFVGSDSESVKKRLRSQNNHAEKFCRFCQAKLSDAFKKVCKNCLTPFTKGLSGEAWVSQAIEHQVNYLEKVDSIKYGAANKGVTSIVRKGAQTIQKLAIGGSRLRPAACQS